MSKVWVNFSYRKSTNPKVFGGYTPKFRASWAPYEPPPQFESLPAFEFKTEPTQEDIDNVDDQELLAFVRGGGRLGGGRRRRPPP